MTPDELIQILTPDPQAPDKEPNRESLKELRDVLQSLEGHPGFHWLQAEIRRLKEHRLERLITSDVPSESIVHYLRGEAGAYHFIERLLTANVLFLDTLIGENDDGDSEST